MNVFIISVRHDSSRYVDSIWVVEQHAVERVQELTDSLQRAGHRVGKEQPWSVWLSEGKVSDAALHGED